MILVGLQTYLVSCDVAVKLDIGPALCQSALGTPFINPLEV